MLYALFLSICLVLSFTLCHRVLGQQLRTSLFTFGYDYYYDNETSVLNRLYAEFDRSANVNKDDGRKQIQRRKENKNNEKKLKNLCDKSSIMDRNKPSSSRTGKSKIGAPHHGSEIFALGSKSSSTSSGRDDVKSKVMSSSTSSSKSSTDRKREASTSLASSTAKKTKLPSLGGGGNSSSGSASGSISHSSRIGETSAGSSTTQQEYWEQVAQDCDASELVQSVLAAIDRQDSNQVR